MPRILKQILITLLIIFPKINLQALPFLGPLSYITGSAAPTQIMYLPRGYHFNDNTANNKQNFVLLSICGFSAGTFNNSFGQQVYFLGLLRDVYSGKLISIHYLVGAMYGYKKKLAHGWGPILGHDPGPVLAIGGQLHLTQHFSIEIATYGLGILGGLSYLL